jgi:hypothetical protein
MIKIINKKTILACFLLSSSAVMADKIIGIGQVGDRFVYKINNTLVSLSPGDIVSGCIVRSSGGLQCDEEISGMVDDDLSIKKMQNRFDKLKTIESLHKDSKELQVVILENKKLKEQIADFEGTYIDRLKKSYIEKINKRNKIINKLSNTLNSERRKNSN